MGLALTDPLGFTVQPIPFLPYSSRLQMIKDLKKIVAEKSVETIVLGLPISLNGTLGPKAVECRKLGNQIQNECGIPVHLQDESYSSREAEEILIREMNLSREKRKKVKDSLSACLILQSYLNSQLSG